MYWRLEKFLDQWTYRKVFPTESDIETFKRIKFSPKPLNAPALLRVRQMGHCPLACRPGTTDAQVLWDAFYHQYHMPPRRLRAAQCIVDLGANVGYTAAHFAKNYPEARIVAVEMNDENADLCEKNIAPFGDRCQLVRGAVWSEDGQIHYGGDENWSFRVTDISNASTGKVRVARAIRLETLLNECQVDRVDYLKMDIEGAEAVVLKEADTWAARVRSMKIELHPPASYEASKELLSACGFQCAKDARHPNCLIAWKPQ